MTLPAAYLAESAAGAAARAIEFLADPHATATACGYDRADGVWYALGQAEALLGGLLDVLGYSEQGPDRFDCEWALRRVDEQIVGHEVVS